MDITTVFGTVIPGSNPGGSTTIKRSVCCAPAAHELLHVRQVRTKNRYTRRFANKRRVLVGFSRGRETILLCM